jgi:uncharacterized membrane protein (UPF0136 family)
MWHLLLWLSVVDATLLIVHEIDSAYWREWELLRLPGGAGGFMALHVPLMALLFVAVLLVRDRATAGLVLAFVMAAAGVVAFALHLYLIRRGNPQFKTAASLTVLGALLAVSLAQIVVGVAIAVS